MAVASPNNTLLYLDCSSGIAGDMLVAALLDLGASEARVRAAVDSMRLDGLEGLRVGRVSKHGIDACDFDVLLDAEHRNHDHDMAWLHSPAKKAHGHEHDRCHCDAHHEHEHSREHAHAHHHHHAHRTLADVTAIVAGADVTDRAREIALRAFGILADAEAAAHGTTRDEVHFHEVGAVDSIVDVVAAAVCLDDLGVTRCAITALSEGHGTIRCAHGIMPVPVPAVANVAMAHGLPLHQTEVNGELVTPTGAALAAAVMTERALPSCHAIRAMGLGAGKRDYECPGVLRAMLVEDLDATARDADETRVWKLECDLDDATGEALGHAVSALLDAGAREAHYLPVMTKKNRPAWQLQAICLRRDVECLESVIFRETTTIGVRRSAWERTVLPREAVELGTPYGPVAAKLVTLPDGTRRAYPEFADVAEAAERTGAGLQDVWQAAEGACADLAKKNLG